MKLTTDGMSIYADGFKVAVLVKKPESHVAAGKFEELVRDFDSGDAKDEPETDVAPRGDVCPVCGY